MARLHALALVLFAACGPQAPSVMDAGSGEDAGCVSDCATVDAGESDASVAPNDAGTETADAGELVDAGEQVDAGAADDAGIADAGCPWACGANEVCAPDQRQCICAEGFHDCDGTCLPDDAAASCGGRCAPCPTVPNATARCSAGSCEIVCDAGFHLCAGECVPDDAVTSCGSRCDPCPAPDHGTAACVSGQCEITCEEGMLPCDGTCSRCFSGSGAADWMCNAANACVAASCQPGFHACSRGCCPDEQQTFETIGHNLAWSNITHAFDLDTNDQPHFAWVSVEAGHYKLHYSSPTPAGRQSEVLFESANVLNELMLELDSSDQPHLAFKEQGWAQYATRENGSWAIEPVASVGYPGARLALGPGAVPHLLATNGQGLVLRVRGSQGWSEETIASDNVSILGQSFTFGPDEVPHAAFVSELGGRLALTHAWRDAQGWHSEEVPGGDGAPGALAVDAGGLVHVVRFAAPDSLAYSVRTTDGTWVSEVVPQVSCCLLGFGGMVLDAAGAPSIALNGPEQGYMTRIASGWKHVRLEQTSGFNHAQIRIDSLGRVHAAYSGVDIEAHANGQSAGLVLVYAH